MTIELSKSYTGNFNAFRKDGDLQASFEAGFDILLDGEKVGFVSAVYDYDAVMCETYDEDDYRCVDEAEYYVDDEFDYLATGRPNACYVKRIDIYDGHLGKGIGSHVLTTFFSRAFLSPDNERAAKLYARIGSEANNAYGEYPDHGYGVYQID